MRSFALMTVCLLFAIPSASAQHRGRHVRSFVPDAAINPEHALMLERAGRYLLRQIELRPDQIEKAEKALETAYAGAEPIPEERLLAITEQLEHVLRSAYRGRMHQVTAELYATNGHSERLDTLARELAPILDDQQKEKLARARTRLSQNPTGAVRPIDLFRIANAFDLTAEQDRDLFAAHAGLRSQIGPLLKFEPERRSFFLKFFAQRMQRLLTPEQRGKLSHGAHALRPDLIDEGLIVPPPPYEDQEIVEDGPEPEPTPSEASD